MSFLARNIKVVRKELGCTQSIMANILKVGFRTFVRYESGEREAPLGTLVKIARLSNISLEKFLKNSIEPNDIAPLKILNKESTAQINSIDFQSGNVTFIRPNRHELMTINDGEKRLLTLYRKMPHNLKKHLMLSMAQIVKTGVVINRLPGKSEYKSKGVKKVFKSKNKA